MSPPGIGEARTLRLDYDRLRPLSYPATSIAPMSFSIDSLDSRESYMYSRNAGAALFLPREALSCGRSSVGVGKARKPCKEYGLLRPLSYPARVVVLTYFSIDSADSRQKYIDSERLDLRGFCRTTSFVEHEAAAEVGEARMQCEEYDHVAATLVPSNKPAAVGQARMQREDYDRLRPLSYPAASVALMSFSIDPPESRENYMVSDRLQLHDLGGTRPIAVGNPKCPLEQPEHIPSAHQDLARDF
ncbi:uncharacterized protein LOC142775247 [Rhipicephalus microplus]|uniref:uncharacterized protein LOC142775247 n=1 Tax=Rhipicephalus microplus TaxID=6941 RepID=UPI003F6CDEC6